ncbi:hypothetical protein BN9982_570020 [Mycobacterium tuberculosis]|nr:hypothetical protein BN9982_570020 [Mycobacterium tuberculosis]
MREVHVPLCLTRLTRPGMAGICRPFRSAGPGTRGADEEDATPAAGLSEHGAPDGLTQLGRFGGLTSQLDNGSP